jgi:hypothetical protein
MKISISLGSIEFKGDKDFEKLKGQVERSNIVYNIPSKIERINFFCIAPSEYAMSKPIKQ